MANKETKRLGNKGFSLVELIVVIAIMAVLVGVLAPQFIRYVEKSRQSTDITTLDSIKQVVESYYADKEGANLPTQVVIAVGSSGNYELTITGGASGVTSSTVLGQGGVDQTPLKGSRWTSQASYKQPKATWDLTNNTWTYEAESDYYTVTNNVIVGK